MIKKRERLRKMWICVSVYVRVWHSLSAFVNDLVLVSVHVRVREREKERERENS